jgi:hypothetical protein
MFSNIWEKTKLLTTIFMLVSPLLYAFKKEGLKGVFNKASDIFGEGFKEAKNLLSVLPEIKP